MELTKAYNKLLRTYRHAQQEKEFFSKYFNKFFKLKKSVEKLKEQYDRDFKTFEITDEKIKKAQEELTFKGFYDHSYNFAILKVAYTRNELQKILEELERSKNE